MRLDSRADRVAQEARSARHTCVLAGHHPGMPAETATASDTRTPLRSRERERAIAELADRQYGVVAREQLAALGFEPGAIGRRVRAGRLHRLHSGIYSVGHRVVSRRGG